MGKVVKESQEMPSTTEDKFHRRWDQDLKFGSDMFLLNFANELCLHSLIL